MSSPASSRIKSKIVAIGGADQIRFRLRVRTDSLEKWAVRYEEFYDDSEVMAIGRLVMETGFLTGNQFRTIARWKTPRSQSCCLKNSEAFVQEVTRSALSSSEPRFKIEALRLLDGVDWPAASVILHFCDQERWPIIDYRAFWSLGQKSPAGRYSFSLWDSYVSYTRLMSDEHEVSMRTLDRALWAYSKVKQK